MVFLYDAACGFCTATVARLAPRFPEVEFRGSRELGDSAELIHAGRTYRGGQAVTGLLRSKGAPGVAAAVLLAAPPLRQLIDAIYRLIARNRHRLPCGCRLVNKSG